MQLFGCSADEAKTKQEEDHKAYDRCVGVDMCAVVVSSRVYVCVGNCRHSCGSACKLTLCAAVGASYWQPVEWHQRRKELPEACLPLSVFCQPPPTPPTTTTHTRPPHSMIRNAQWSEWHMTLMARSREYQGERKLRVNVQRVRGSGTRLYNLPRCCWCVACVGATVMTWCDGS
jgi:hypothetical protein